jgi:hypothetical protein
LFNGLLLMCFFCEHDKVVSAVDDLLSLVVDNNLGHYFAATQDSDLPNVLCVLVYYVWNDCAQDWT